MAAILALIVGLMASMLSAVIVAGPVNAAEAANIDQCQNGPIAAPTNCTAAGDWGNGNIGPNKAHFAEGDSVPYRLVMTGLTPNAVNTVSFAWDTTKGGKHAFDYVTTFDRTVVGADPCAGVTGCGAPTTFPIPVDPNVTAAGVTQIPGNFTLFGGTISGASSYTLSGTYAGDSTTSITLTFASPTDTAVLAWGGHISTRLDWGMTNSAVAISGSPYHMALGDLNGKGGNQDLQLSAAAVVFPGSITIIKDAVPNDAQDFNFTTTGGLTPATFTLDDDPGSAAPTNTQAFTNITTFGTYTVTEADTGGWTPSFGTPPCTVTSANSGTQSAVASTVTIELKEGENVTCTFTNTRQTGTITVNKVVSPANDPGLFNLQIDGATAGTGANVGNGGTTGAVTVTAGTHTVGETAGDNAFLPDWSSSIACSNGAAGTGAGPLTVVVANGANVVCTITNTRRTGTITINKVLSPANDPGRFNLQIGGATAGTGANVGNGGTTGAVTVQTGTYSIRETAGTNTTLADYTSTIACTGGEEADGAGPLTLTVSGNENVVCTIINIRKTGTLTVVKSLSPANDPGLFNLQIDGATAGTGANVGHGGTTGAITLQTGTHTVRETAGTNTSLTNYTSSIACTNGAASSDAGPLAIVVTDGANITCTVTNIRKADENECPQGTRRPASRGVDPQCLEAPQPEVQPTTPPAGGDPNTEVAGETNQGRPAPEQSLGGETERPVPDPDPGILGRLPRTGAGIIGQATLALLLIGGGLVLRLARRRRPAADQNSR